MEDIISRRDWPRQNSRRRTHERKNHGYVTFMVLAFNLATLSLIVNGQVFFQRNTLDNDSIIQAATSSTTIILILFSIQYTYKRNRNATKYLLYVIGVIAIFTAIYAAVLIYRALVTPKCMCNTNKARDVLGMLKEGPSALDGNSSESLYTRDKVLKILDILEDTAEKGLESTTKKKSSFETTTTTSNGVERRTEEIPSFIITATHELLKLVRKNKETIHGHYCDCDSTEMDKFPKDQIYITVSFVIIFISQVMHGVTLFKYLFIKRKALDRVLEKTDSDLASSLNNFNFIY